MSQLVLGIVIGIIGTGLAYAFVMLENWIRERIRKKRAIHRLLTEAAVAEIEPDDRWGAW